MKKLTTQLIKELSSLSEAIPAGFKGLFAKSSGLSFKDSSADEHKLVSTNNRFKSTDFENAVARNIIVWPNCYDTTRPGIKNSFLNSSDVLVNLIELGGSVSFSNGIGAISTVHVAAIGTNVANEVDRTAYLDGGSGYIVGDVLTLLDGENNATVTVASVDGSGKVVTVSLTSAGTNYKTNSSCPVSGGTGSGCKIYIASVAGSARNPSAGSTINKIFQADGQAGVTGGRTYWTGVSANSPVEITVNLPTTSKSVDRILIVPGGRNQAPYSYKVEVVCNSAYYGSGNRWYNSFCVSSETDTYIKLIPLLASEYVKTIRITVFESGDNPTYAGYFSLAYLVGYARYIEDGRFLGYGMSASGDTVYNDYVFRGAGYKTDSSKEIKILPESKQVVVGGTALASGSETIDFDSSAEPTQTGTVVKTTLWLFQYFAKAIKWLNANFANYSLSTHNHALNNLSEKSYNSLTNKPAIPPAQTDTDWNSESSPNRLLNKYGFVEDYPESIQAFEGKVYLRIEDTWKFFPNLELVCVKSVKSDHGSYTSEFKEEFLTELIGRSTDMNLVFKAFRIEWYNYTGEEPTPSSYFKVSDFTALYYIIKPAFQYYYANNSNHFTIHIYDIVDKSTKCGDITFGNTAYGMLTHRLGSSVGINLFSNYSSLVSPFNSLGEWLLNYFFQIASPTADDSIITTRNTMKIGKQPKRTNSTWFRNFSGNMYDDVNNTVTSVSENTFICGDPILLCTTDSYTMAIETANVFGLLKYGQLGMSMVLVYPIQSVGGYKAFYYTPVGVDAVRIKDSNIQDTGHYDIMVSVYRKNKRKIEIMTNATEVVLNGVPSWRKYLTRNNDIWQYVRDYNATTKVTFCLVNTAIGYRTLESDRYLKMDRHVATIPWTLLPALKIKGD